MRFYDREVELAAIRRCFGRPASLSLIYGQRRVGKTAMLQRALRDERGARYYLADQSTAPQQLRRFHGTIVSEAASDAGAPDWGTALELMVLRARGRRLVVVLDEFQYLLDADPTLPSVVQRIWDTHSERASLHLVLCGSALGTLARLGEAEQPLHGRFDLKMKVSAFDYRTAALFVPGWGATDALLAYGIFGGLARHLAELDPAVSLGENVARALVDPLGPLHEAALDRLRVERLSSLPEASAVLEAIADGECRQEAIAARTGLKRSRLDYLLKELMALELVERRVRYGDRPGARYTRYACTDPGLTFWFRLLYPNRPALAGGADPRRVWIDRIAPRLDDHMGPVFERVVAQRLPSFLIDRVGIVDRIAGWWSRDGQLEIDHIAQVGDVPVAVECKWRGRSGQPVGLRELDALRRRAALCPALRGQAVRLCLATAGAFTAELRAAAAAEGVALLGPEALFDTR